MTVSHENEIIIILKRILKMHENSMLFTMNHSTVSLHRTERKSVSRNILLTVGKHVQYNGILSCNIVAHNGTVVLCRADASVDPLYPEFHDFF